MKPGSRMSCSLPITCASGYCLASSSKRPTALMTPSSCSTAPPAISFQQWRSIAWVTSDRLRIKVADMVLGPQSFLLGKRAIDFILEQCGQLTAQRLGSRRERIARPRQIDRHDGLDPPRTGGENDDPIGQRDGLVDMVRHEQHRGAGGLPDIQQEALHACAGLHIERREGFI